MAQGHHAHVGCLQQNIGEDAELRELRCCEHEEDVDDDQRQHDEDKLHLGLNRRENAVRRLGIEGFSVAHATTPFASS